MRESSDLLFDPESFKDIYQDMKIENYRLNQLKLLEYARSASRTRSEFKDKARQCKIVSGHADAEVSFLVQHRNNNRSFLKTDQCFQW